MAFKVKDLMINIAPGVGAQPMTCLQGATCDVGRTDIRPIPCACTGDYTCGWSHGPITVFLAQRAAGQGVGAQPMTCLQGATCDVGRTDIRPIPCACTADLTCGWSRGPITVFYAQRAAGQGVGAAPAAAIPEMPICVFGTGCLCTAVGTACACTNLGTLCAACTNVGSLCGACSVRVTLCDVQTYICGDLSLNQTVTPTLCPGYSVIGPVPVPVGGDPVAASQQLAALKAQLQQAVAEIEKQQAAVDASLQPQTVAEVEDLQSKMRDALDELDKRKAELQQKQGQ